MQRETTKTNFPLTNDNKKKAENQPPRPVRLNKPVIVDYMSVDVLREYHHNLSQLKYLTSIPKGQLHLDLNHNIEKAVKRTTGGNNEKILLLLKFILDQKHWLESLINEDIITYRRTLISVMCNIYDGTPVSIIASLFNNCIYLCSLEIPQEVTKRQSCNEIEKFCAWGYKYEQFMLSDSPRSEPDIEKPILENEEFSIYYQTQLGSHRLFYGAQIDGMMATTGPIKGVPNTNDLDANLTFLRQNCFVELKTQREMNHRQQVINFKKYKLLRCWCQCYLADLEGLLVGYRNDDGIIQRVEWFDTAGIVRFCKGIWDPQRSLTFLDSFLNFVKESFISTKASLGESFDSKIPLTLKFDIDRQHKFTVCKTDDDTHIILPSWYIQNLK